MANVLQHPQAEFYRYFTDRGLTQEEATSGLGAGRIEPDELKDHIPGYIARKWEMYGCGGVIIPTNDIHGETTESYIVRRNGGNVPPGAAEKIGKVAYSKTGIPRAHFPRANPELEKGTIIFLCESVVKAEVVAKCGFYAIGVNGCWGYSRNYQLMDDIKDLPWELIAQIRVFYDSNYSTSDHVRAGANRFAAYCKQEINFDAVEITILPPAADGSEWGCDDAFKVMGEDWLVAVLEADSISPEFSAMDDLLFKLNEEVCIVQSTARCYRYDLEDIAEYTFADVHKMYAPWKVLGPPPKQGQPKMVAVSRVWEGWKHRTEVPIIDMRPNEPRVVPGQFLNCWWDPQLVAGKPSKRWAEFMANFIEEDESRVWLEQWIGHLIQHPAVKMHSYPVLVSGPATGKTMVTTMVERLLGAPNCAMIGQEDMENSFNGFHAEKLFVAINEFERRRGDYTGVGNKMKGIVTATTLMANSKNIRHRKVKAVSNYMITTNSVDALKLEEDDRRAGVIDCNPIVSHYDDPAYFEPLFEEIMNKPQGILGYYLNMDLAGFNRVGNAISTMAKAEMTANTRQPTEALAYRLVHDKEAMLAELDQDPDLKYVSLTMLVGHPKVQQELGVTALNYNDARLKQILGQHLNGAGAPTLVNRDGGRVGARGQKHRVCVLPGGSKHEETDVVVSHLKKWKSGLGR